MKKSENPNFKIMNERDLVDWLTEEVSKTEFERRTQVSRPFFDDAGRIKKTKDPDLIKMNQDELFAWLLEDGLWEAERDRRGAVIRPYLSRLTAEKKPQDPDFYTMTIEEIFSWECEYWIDNKERMRRGTLTEPHIEKWSRLLPEKVAELEEIYGNEEQDVSEREFDMWIANSPSEQVRLKRLEEIYGFNRLASHKYQMKREKELEYEALRDSKDGYENDEKKPKTSKTHRIINAEKSADLSLLNVFLRVNISRFSVPIGVVVGIPVFLFFLTEGIGDYRGRRSGFFHLLANIFGDTGLAILMGAGIGALAWAAASLADEKVSEEHRKQLALISPPSIFQGENYIKVILTGHIFRANCHDNNTDFWC